MFGRRKFLVVVAALVAASATLVFTIGAGAGGRSRDLALPGASAAPAAAKVNIGRVLPRRIAGTDYQTGGVALRNQAGGGITINGITGPTMRAYLWWAVLTMGPPVAGTYDTVRLQRAFPGPVATQNGVGAIVGAGPSPCWPGSDTITIYELAVNPAVASGNGLYRVGFPAGAGASVAGQDPWVVGAIPALEGATLGIVYQAPGDTLVYSIPRAGRPPMAGHTLFSGGILSYDLALPAGLGAPDKWDEVVADGQVAVSRRADPAFANETAAVDATLVAGTGSSYNDSDWNGSDGKPLPQLWDTAGHDIAGIPPAGAVNLHVDLTTSMDCVTTVANLVHLKPAA
jgi:hypothetical protein